MGKQEQNKQTEEAKRNTQTNKKERNTVLGLQFRYLGQQPQPSALTATSRRVGRQPRFGQDHTEHPCTGAPLHRGYSPEAHLPQPTPENHPFAAQQNLGAEGLRHLTWDSRGQPRHQRAGPRPGLALRPREVPTNLGPKLRFGLPPGWLIWPRGKPSWTRREPTKIPGRRGLQRAEGLLRRQPSKEVGRQISRLPSQRQEAGNWRWNWGRPRCGAEEEPGGGTEEEPTVRLRKKLEVELRKNPLWAEARERWCVRRRRAWWRQPLRGQNVMLAHAQWKGWLLHYI